MSQRKLHWVNSPVLFEAIIRYEQGRLPRSMKLWVEQLLDLKSHEQQKLLPNSPHS
ncbi:hypothetical protein [Prochlorococcus sp. MIT 1307]|uniref:hypothetical protein n=1 Tax=Prochlorococcus sp. MIT 1307 TaxID=3096219 RepID=UPI002A75D942|nr:hypothetical protein [Prochlorococcus sp. MIT 1307]